MQFRTRNILLYGLIGYLVGLVTYNFLPPFITMAIPMAAIVAGAVRSRRRGGELPSSPQNSTLPPEAQSPAAVPISTSSSAPINLGAQSRPPQPQGPHSQPQSNQQQSRGQQANSQHPQGQHSQQLRGQHSPQGQQPSQPPVDDGMREMMEYIALIEEMVISEGQKHNLDDEIVEKTLSLLARIHRVIPQLVELDNAEINHNMKRLVLRDLNGFVTPFLKLSGEMKRKNRRLLLDGLKNIQSKINSYVETLEQKDLVELQTKADIIHQRYSTRQF